MLLLIASVAGAVAVSGGTRVEGNSLFLIGCASVGNGGNQSQPSSELCPPSFTPTEASTLSPSALDLKNYSSFNHTLLWDPTTSPSFQPVASYSFAPHPRSSQAPSNHPTSQPSALLTSPKPSLLPSLHAYSPTGSMKPAFPSSSPTTPTFASDELVSAESSGGLDKGFVVGVSVALFSVVVFLAALLSRMTGENSDRGSSFPIGSTMRMPSGRDSVTDVETVDATVRTPEIPIDDETDLERGGSLIATEDVSLSDSCGPSSFDLDREENNLEFRSATSPVRRIPSILKSKRKASGLARSPSLRKVRFSIPEIPESARSEDEKSDSTDGWANWLFFDPASLCSEASAAIEANICSQSFMMEQERQNENSTDQQGQYEGPHTWEPDDNGLLTQPFSPKMYEDCDSLEDNFPIQVISFEKIFEREMHKFPSMPVAGDKPATISPGLNAYIESNNKDDANLETKQDDISNTTVAVPTHNNNS